MAGLVIEINIEGRDLLVRKFNMFRAQMRYGLLPAWIKIGNRLMVEEMAMAPVDTGRLRNNIQVSARAMGVDSWSAAFDPRNGFNYARIMHDGGMNSGYRRPMHVGGSKYMEIPLHRSPSYAVDILSDQIDRIIAICGLG